ncbi:N-acetylmuramoyl-L-alanine amidase [Sulfuricella sp. T08]
MEAAFISNPEEERKQTEDTYQEKMADAILSGIILCMPNKSN